MAQPSLASVEDLEARMGLTVDPTRAEAALTDASALIHLASQNAWLDDDGELVDDVHGVAVAICCAAARRVLENPLSVSNETQTIAGYSDSRTYGNASNDVYLTKAEIKRVRSAAGLVGLGVLSTTRGPLETPAVNHPGDVWPEEETIPWPTA